MKAISLGFASAYRDPVTDGYPLGHGYRWYLPSLMRFNAPDAFSPFGAGGVHPYAYCAADPINYCDPSGHMFGLAGVEMTELTFKVIAHEQRMDADEAIAAQVSRADANPARHSPLSPDSDAIVGTFSAPTPQHLPITHSVEPSPASPPANRSGVEHSASGVHQPTATSNQASASGPTQSLRFMDWFDRAKDNPEKVPGIGRPNPNWNILYSFSKALKLNGLKLSSLPGNYKRTLATGLNMRSAEDLDARVYNAHWSATDNDRKEAFRLIADVIDTSLGKH